MACVCLRPIAVAVRNVGRKSSTAIAYPERLRQQFEGVIWRFKPGGQWREVPQKFGAWSTVHNRFRQWRDAGVFEALLGGLIKVHLAADRQCRPLAFVLTAAQAADSPQFPPVLGKLRVRGPVGRLRTRPDAVGHLPVPRDGPAPSPPGAPPVRPALRR